MSGAFGAVAREENGNFIAAASWLMPHVPNVDSAEMTAIRNGFYLAAGIGCSKLITESNSSFAVDAMKGENDYAGPSGPVTMESKQLMKGFGQVDFLHCFREANEVANTIAKYAFSFSTSCVWDAIPNFISSSLVNDLSII